jgi:hypothetical protein
MLKIYSSKTLCFLFVFALALPCIAVQSSQFWTKQNNSQSGNQRSWYPHHYSTFSLQFNAMKDLLATAPMEENSASRKSSFEIELPMPDGNLHRYTLVESPVMEPGLAAAFPGIKTYAGVGIDDPSAYIRCDITPFGFHGFILSPNGIVYIDPVSRGNTEEYIVYFKRDIPAELFQWQCEVTEENQLNIDERNIDPASAASIGATLRTYRLALACTGEYATYHGGTKATALAAMVTTMNRVNGVYELELDIHMNIIANDTLLIYLNASTDPYTNNNGGTMLTQNQTTCTNVIGTANYDIGHVFSTGGGGIAYLGCVCQASHKAKGVTGLPSPVGDAFAIDYVAHEMGHQFGGNHSFNSITGACSGGNRWGPSAYEPGSGSTIMAYAGICGSDDLQSNSDAYFHTRSFNEIITYSQSGSGNGCAVQTASGNNPPVITVPSPYYIPIKTPFSLTATGSDPDGEPITYCWEQWDVGGTGQAWNTQLNGVNAPIFRSWLPVTTPTRLFPKLSKILNPSITVKGEVMAIYARVLHFRCTVRDNHAGCGGVVHSASTSNVNVVASDTGGFAVLYPNALGVNWLGNSTQTITWHVAGTTNAPISTANVNIYLSTDAGQTFPTTIATNVPNNGSYTFTVPNLATVTQCRVKIEGAGNIFFDINNANFTITFATGINENILSNNISVYPNPAGNQVNCIVNTLTSGKGNIMILDIAGRIVKQIRIEKANAVLQETIDISDLANGAYIVHFEMPDGVADKQLIKQ